MTQASGEDQSERQASQDRSQDQSDRQGNGYPVVFQDVGKSFGEKHVLDCVSFAVSPGEALCLLGRSGTGKSVTLKLMIGLIKADRGKVLIEGEDLGALDEDGLSRVRRRMGYMFQNAALFDSFSLHDNLALPLRRLARGKSKDEQEDAIQQTLQQVGLEKDGGKMPVELSGGMLKRAGLARALVLEPEILLVDEPNSGLDRITSHEISDLLLKVKHERKTTMVIVTHDLEGARAVGDRFAVLDQGKLAALGTPDELAGSDNDLVKQIIGVDQ